jgi:hypothetical protein
VSFEKDGSPIEILQTKHHVAKTGDLSNASAMDAIAVEMFKCAEA